MCFYLQSGSRRLLTDRLEGCATVEGKKIKLTKLPLRLKPTEQLRWPPLRCDQGLQQVGRIPARSQIRGQQV